MNDVVPVEPPLNGEAIPPTKKYYGFIHRHREDGRKYEYPVDVHWLVVDENFQVMGGGSSSSFGWASNDFRQCVPEGGTAVFLGYADITFLGTRADYRAQTLGNLENRGVVEDPRMCHDVDAIVVTAQQHRFG